MRTFKRGVHPAGNKHYSQDVAIREILPGKEMLFPVAQHIGAPSTPIVNVGDRVLKGQTIAVGSSFVSADICSSVSGTVTKISPSTTLMGETMDTIFIENDEQYETIESFGVERDYTSLSNEQILECIKKAGIVGLGGAGFPTHVKLAPKDPAIIDTFIVNGAECEPYLTSDYRLMIEKTNELFAGIQIVLKLFPNASGVIAIEDNKPEAIKLLSEKCSDFSNIRVETVKTKYPQGGERMLIHAITGRDINHFQLPADAKCVVDNVASVIAVYDAVCLQMPLIKRVMTFTGPAVKKPCNILVSIGDNYQRLVNEVGGFSSEPKKIVSGGPMMGMSMFSLDIPIIKTSASVLAFVEDDMEKFPTTSCIHCGRCANACPENLIPQLLYDAMKKQDLDRFEKLYGMECIECGSCSYVCPAKIPLTQSFQFGRRSVAARNRAKKMSEKKDGDNK